MFLGHSGRTLICQRLVVRVLSCLVYCCGRDGREAGGRCMTKGGGSLLNLMEVELALFLYSGK